MRKTVASILHTEQLFLEDLPRAVGTGRSVCAFPKDLETSGSGDLQGAGGRGMSPIPGCRVRAPDGPAPCCLCKSTRTHRAPATDTPLIETLCDPRGKETGIITVLQRSRTSRTSVSRYQKAFIMGIGSYENAG